MKPWKLGELVGTIQSKISMNLFFAVLTLCNALEYGRLSSFDSTQPLRRYLGAIRQMMRE